jgi:ribosomal protein L11 methyltransferase
MGAGTGILAILSAMRGAKNVLAIDNDEWAYNNCCENVEKNRINTVKTVLGDAHTIGNKHYDIILANINRNILLQDMHLYANALNENGSLLLSGFYLYPDLPVIEEAAKKYNLILQSYREQNNWVAARFRKQIIA